MRRTTPGPVGGSLRIPDQIACEVPLTAQVWTERPVVLLGRTGHQFAVLTFGEGVLAAEYVIPARHSLRHISDARVII